MTEPSAPAIIPATPVEDAYTLLSRPTLDLTDAQVETIVADLRRRRRSFIEQGIKDEPAKKKAAAKKLEPDDKKANTLSLLSQLKLGPSK